MIIKLSKIKNVLYIISTLRDCGPTNQLYGLIKNLNRNQYSPYILTLSNEKSNSRLIDFDKLDINITSLGLTNIQMVAYGKKKLVKKVKKINPDIIHTHGLRPDYYASRFLRNYMLLNTIHNYPNEDYVFRYGKLIGNCIAYIHLNSLKKFDHLIACSYTNTKKFLKQHHLKTYTVQNGIDKNYFSVVNEKMKYKLRDKLNLSKNKMLFVYAGKLSSLKDPLTLIKAFKKSKINNKAQLIILGEGPLKEKCSKIANSEIYLRGKVDNVRDYFRASDVLVSASTTEGMPISVLEGMGTGLPLLLSDIQVHKEILNLNSNIGDDFLVGNVDDLSNHFKNYLNYDVKNKGLEARKVLEEHFSAKIMSYSYQKIYRKLLK